MAPTVRGRCARRAAARPPPRPWALLRRCASNRSLAAPRCANVRAPTVAAALGCLALAEICKCSSPSIASRLLDLCDLSSRLKSKLHAPDKFVNWNKVAGNAIDEATKMVDDGMRVLEAEAVLARTLRRLEAPHHGARAAAAAEQLKRSSVFNETVGRVGLYDSVRENLAPTGFRLCWNRSDAEMHIRSPPGASWFEYRLVAHIDAPLRHCLAPLHERDLIQRYQPVFVEPHQDIGPSGPHHAVIRTLSRVWSVYVETVFELLRVTNREFGFLVETCQSDFHAPDRRPPGRPWWARRIGVDTRNLWMPRGGGEAGTVLVSVARVQVGVPIPENMLTFIFHSFAESILDNVQRGSALVAEPNSPWRKRLEKDADGFYAELALAEEAAKQRKAISFLDLPGPEVFDREPRLAA